MKLLGCVRRQYRAQSLSYDLMLLGRIACCRTVHLIYNEDHLAGLVLIDSQASEVICHIRIE